MQSITYNYDITKYYSDNTPINLIITNIINESDDFLILLYEHSKEYEKKDKNIRFLTDIIAIQYCSIRCIYDMPDLCNIHFRNNRPTTNHIFGEDKTILASMIIQVDCLNAILHFLNDYYPNKVADASKFIDKILNLDNDIELLLNSSYENLQIYKNKILELYKELFVFLNE
jgi:hypothetical protein